MRNLRFKPLLAAFALVASMTVPLAQAQVTLPPVFLPSPGGGLPAGQVALQYDAFFSYSGTILNALANLPGNPYGIDPFFADKNNLKSAPGGLNLALFTGPNQSVNNDNLAKGFPVPSNTVTGSDTTYFGYYPATDPSAPNAITPAFTVTVNQVLDFLHNSFGPDVNTPVFIFDFNQTGSNRGLLADGVVRITDPVTNAVIKDFALDSSNDGGVFQLADLATIPATVEFPAAGEPGAGSVIPPTTTDLGAGFSDFIIVDPSMDLSQFAGDNLTFLLNMTQLNDGFEQLYLNGTIAFIPPAAVPEPGTMVLMGLGVLGLLAARKRMGKLI